MRGSGERRPVPRPSAYPTATVSTCSSSRAGPPCGASTTSSRAAATRCLGAYPEVSLTLARQRRAEAREKVAAGIDPSRERQEAREAAVQAMTFDEVADEWLERQRHVLAPVTFEKATWMLKSLVNPWLGKRPIAEIEPPELLSVLRRIESRGKHETAHRTKQRCGQVFRYAIATGRAQRDPSADLRDALTRREVAASGRRHAPRASRRTPQRHRRVPRELRRPVGPPTRAARVRASWRTPEGGVERD